MVLLWRRRLAGDFSASRAYQTRRRDAGATKNLLSLVNHTPKIPPISRVVRSAD